jgi:hypothetical protein
MYLGKNTIALRYKTNKLILAPFNILVFNNYPKLKKDGKVTEFYGMTKSILGLIFAEK